MGKLRIGFSSIANPQAFAENPERAWGFYGHRLMMYRQTVPHLGFRLLKELGEKLKHGYFVFTSNVDGQFQKAGFDPEKIYECHGSIHALQCKHYGELARPSIVIFNDWHWQEWPYQQQNQRLNDWLKQVKSPLVIEIGAGVAIPTVRYFSEEVANGGERLIRINPANATIRLGCGVSLTMGGLAGIEMIVKEALAIL